MGIISRNLNMKALAYSKLLTKGGVFYLHNPAVIERINSTWVFNPLAFRPPLTLIKNYFGEKIAIYFAWLEYYTFMLALPAFVGCVMYVTGKAVSGHGDTSSLIFFGGFVSLWSMHFVNGWKKRNSFINLWWGTSFLKSEAKERVEFVGNIRYSPVNDRKELYHVSRGALHRRMIVGSSILGVCMLISITATGACMYLKTVASPAVAGAVNALQIMILNEIYWELALFINNWENHRTQHDFDSNLTVKVFIFTFCNTYSSFFYIAFIKAHFEQGGCIFPGAQGCMKELEIQIQSIFITQIFVGNCIEIVYPYMKYQAKRMKELLLSKLKNMLGKEIPDLTNFNYEPPEKQAQFAPYDDREVFKDYKEMVIQYGFVTLFVVAYPLAPALALLNNLLEVHVDGYKLTLFQRPNPHKTNSIGMWEYFLALLSKMSVATNLALVFFVSDLFDPKTGAYPLPIGMKWLVFFFVEHLLLYFSTLFNYEVEGSHIHELVRRHRWIAEKLSAGPVEEDNDDDLQEEAEENINLEIMGPEQSLASNLGEINDSSRYNKLIV